MTTMTVPAIVSTTQSAARRGVSQLTPALLAIVIVAATAVVSVLLAGPMP